MRPPAELGRSVVVLPDHPPPPAWSHTTRVRLERLDDPEHTGPVVDTLQRAWATRTPLVIELGVDPAELRVPEHITETPWEVGSPHLFARERLLFLVWNNSVDARGDEPVWWWSHKAAVTGAVPGGPADVLLPDGTPAWIDGGPRGLVADVGHRVIHAESIRTGRSLDTAPHAITRIGFDPSQAAAVLHPAGPARVIAPAGSGKTRTLIGRVVHLVETVGVDPASVLALAYNRRAREELIDRLPATARRVDARTIHALGWSIIRQAHPNTRVLDERETRGILDRLAPAQHQTNTDRIGPYLEAMTEVRVALRTPGEVEERREDVPEFARVFRQYRERLRSIGAVDHEEQICAAIELLLMHPTLRAERQARHRHVLVDEFQDLTPAYMLLLRLVAAPELTVFGVGDDDQTIYGYSGADPRFLIEYDTWFPGAAEYALSTNYRSDAVIVKAATTLLSHNRRRIDKQIEAAPDATSTTEALTVTTLPGDEIAEHGARLLAEWRHDGVGCVALARVHAALLPLHVACQLAGIPTTVHQEGAFTARTGVAAALAWLRIARNPDEIRGDDLAHALRRPPSALVRVVQEHIPRYPTSFEALLQMERRLEGSQQNNARRLIERIQRLSRLARRADTHRLIGAIVDELAPSALKLDTSRPAGAGGHSDDLVALSRLAVFHDDPDTFEAWLKERLSVPPADDAISLTTVHRVKGLEWDRVLIVGVDDGTLPHRLATSVEEERRILHVAVTRARHRTVVMAAAESPSPFVPQLRETYRAPAAPPPPSARGPLRPPARSRRSDSISARVGDTVTVAGGYRGTVTEVGEDHIRVKPGRGGLIKVLAGERIRVGSVKGVLVIGGMREELRRFRAEEARRRGAPPFTIFNDATLDELVDRHPTTPEQLLAIHGIGPGKLASFGDAILEILNGR